MRGEIADFISGGKISRMQEDMATMARKIDNLNLEVESSATKSIESVADFDWMSRLEIDQQWVSASGASSDNIRFIRKDVVDLYADLANFMYHFNPLIKRAVDIKTLFTFSQSFTVSSKSAQTDKLINRMFDDLINKQSSLGQQAIQEADGDLQRSGNIFFAVWTNPAIPQIRIWSSADIADIIMDENDSDRPMYYVKIWWDASHHLRKVAYPSVFNGTYSGIAQYNGSSIPVDNTIKIYHMSSRKSLRQKWALSELSAAMRWAKAHEGFLEDFAAIVKAIRKYTHMFTVKGDSNKAAAVASGFAGNKLKMQTPFQSNPAGSMIVATEGNELKTMDAGAGKIVGAVDSRYLLIMVCAGTAIPETLLTGDPSTGNLATAKELTGPFLTLIESRQTDWKDTLRIVFQTAVDSEEVDVSFPPIRSQDALDYVDALIKTATLGQPGKYAGTIDAETLVTACFEALDLDLDDETKDKIVNGFLDMSAGANTVEPELTSAIERMVHVMREVQHAEA